MQVPGGVGLVEVSPDGVGEVVGGAGVGTGVGVSLVDPESVVDGGVGAGQVPPLGSGLGSPVPGAVEPTIGPG